MSPDSVETTDAPTDEVEYLLGSINDGSFRDWYREREFRHNIEDGTPYFNTPGSAPEPERHSPSKLLQCPRKIYYRNHNAPAEQADPYGIFWIGSRFEEDIIFPYLERAVTGPDTYVQNSIWIDFEAETEVGDLRIKGVTDPVIVDEDATPILPLEIKTKTSVEHLDSPNEHHKAQLHAYLVGLSDKYEIDLNEGMILYGSRNTFDIKAFHVEFDPAFWEGTVLDWASKQTLYRIDEVLPPDEPRFDWECEFCDYRERCGRGESAFADADAVGFLPGLSYPRESISDHLAAHPDAKLTPKLARDYPDLVEEFGVEPWVCPTCGSEYEWGTNSWKDKENPICSDCVTRDSIVEMRGRVPSTGRQQEGNREHANQGQDSWGRLS